MEMFMTDHGGNIFQAARAMGLRPEELIDFSASINPLGPSPKALKAILKAQGQIVHYPDPECRLLIDAICRHHRIKREQLLIGNGSAELIYLVATLFRKRSVLISNPTFSEYARAVAAAGGKPVETMNMAPPLEMEIDSLLHEKSVPFQGLFLCHPNNPTGRLYPKKELLELIERAEEKGVTVVLDEAFIDYHEEESLVRETGRFSRLIVLRSFTKFFAMPGLRAGYAVLGEPLAKRLRKTQIPWSVNTLAQAAAAASLDDHRYIQKSRRWMAGERDWFFRQLSRVAGLKPVLPSANFILVECLPPFSSTALSQKLLEHKILIRDCANFPGLGDRYIRLAIRTRRENRLLLSAFRKILGPSHLHS
jgi:threonine-phosphate decarboxylase